MKNFLEKIFIQLKILVDQMFLLTKLLKLVSNKNMLRLIEIIATSKNIDRLINLIEKLVS